MRVVSCPSCARQGFDVIRTVQTLEERLQHIKTPMSLSVLGCVVNGPGEARETDIGITGGGQGKHMVYLSGITDHHVQDADMIDHIVRLVEAKAAEIEAAEACRSAPNRASLHRRPGYGAAMIAPRQQPILAFMVALAAVGVLSVMDAVMKGLVLAIGLYATMVWRALVGFILSSLLYLPQPQGLADAARSCGCMSREGRW